MSFWQVIIVALAKEIGAAIGSAIKDFLKWKQKAKENKEEVRDIQKIKDPKERAARMRDFLDR